MSFLRKSGIRKPGNPFLRLVRATLRLPGVALLPSAGGELEQIQFLFGHASVQTTEKYLACKQRLREAVNNKIGIEPVLAEENV